MLLILGNIILKPTHNIPIRNVFHHNLPNLTPAYRHTMAAGWHGWDPSFTALGPCGGWRGADEGGLARVAVLALQRRPMHTRTWGRAWDRHWSAQTVLAPGVWCIFLHRQPPSNASQCCPGHQLLRSAAGAGWQGSPGRRSLLILGKS